MKFTFDKQQLQVINHQQGHGLILAGAGSGKTASIVERAVKMIESGGNPNEIVIVTFTNKAAREARQRIYMRLKEIYDGESPQPSVTTFHAFGQRIIHKNTEACGRTGIPSLLEADDQDSLFNKSLRKYITDFDCKLGSQFYEKIRNIGLSAGYDADLPKITSLLKDYSSEVDRPVRWESFLQSFIDYETEKQNINALDYHDLLILPIQALKKDPALLKKFQKHVKDLTVDEAQDTNLAQYELIKLLVPPETTTQTVIMIGDEDQSIHRWRGANPENLRLFNEAYRPTLHRLENNYRSLPEIVNRAESVIQNNLDRFDKKGISVRKSLEEPVSYKVSAEASEMGDKIAESIKASINSGVEPNEIAILYRTNRMATLLEPALIARSIPYQIYNGQDLLGRSEAKILLAAIRLAINPYDRLAFNKLSEIIPRVGKKVLELIEEGMGNNKSSVFDEVMKLSAPQQANIVPMLTSIYKLRQEGPKALGQWAAGQPDMQAWIIKKSEATLKTKKLHKPKAFDVWKQYNRNQPISPEERQILAETGVIKSCENHQKRLNETIGNTIDRMKLVWKTINDRCAQLSPDASLEDQWFEANAVIAAPPDEEKKRPSVHLMSIHASKGLEFKEVHLAGFSNGLLPLNIDTNPGNEHLEDERRLAYVGITRAKDKLHVHHAEHINLMDGKGYRYVKPSIFSEEAGFVEEEKQEEYESMSISF